MSSSIVDERLMTGLPVSSGKEMWNNVDIGKDSCEDLISGKSNILRDGKLILDIIIKVNESVGSKSSKGCKEISAMDPK